MLKFLQKFSLQSLKQNLIIIFNRFPLSALISICSFVLMIFLIRLDDLSQNTEEIMMKAFVTLIISFFFSVAIYLYTESKNLLRPKKCFYQGFTLLFSVLFYYFFEKGLFSGFEAETVVYVVLSIIGVASFLFIASYFQVLIVKVKDQDEFYVGSYELSLKILMSAIVGIVTMILGFIAFTAIFTLFDLESLSQDHWYTYWSSFSLLLFAPFFFLVNVPKKEEGGLNKITNIVDDKFFAFLINYIALPAIYIYFIILYAYTIKVLLNFKDWPHGEVAWMVILFSFFGYLVYFATYAFTEKFKQAKFFRQIFPSAVILQTAMLFYAIGLRINQYDLTINRYAVLVFGLWLFFLSAYYIASSKKDLSMPFYSLLIIVILMSIGPWSIYLVPEKRQQNRLVVDLETAKILQNGKIIPLLDYQNIDAQLSGDIYGSIEYLCNYHGCVSLDKIFAKEIVDIKIKHKEDFEKNKKETIERLKKEDASEEDIKNIEENKYSEINNWELITKLAEYLKVERWDSYAQDAKKEEAKYLVFENINRYNFSANIDVKNYDYYLPLGSAKNEKDLIDDKENSEEEDVKERYEAVIDVLESKFTLYFGEKVLEEIDIQENIFEKILNNEKNYIKPKHNDVGIKALLPENDLTFEFSGKSYDIKVVLQSVSIKNPKWKQEQEIDDVKNDNKIETLEYNSAYVDGYVLIREKKEVK